MIKLFKSIFPEQSAVSETVWHKCWRARLFARVEGPDGMGQLWRRKINGRWEYKRDAETMEDAESRWW